MVETQMEIRTSSATLSKLSRQVLAKNFSSTNILFQHVQNHIFRGISFDKRKRLSPYLMMLPAQVIAKLAVRFDAFSI